MQVTLGQKMILTQEILKNHHTGIKMRSVLNRTDDASNRAPTYGEGVGVCLTQLK